MGKSWDVPERRRKAFIVLASFVLEPDSDDPGTEASHLRQLLLHEGVRPRVRRVPGLQGMQLFLV